MNRPCMRHAPGLLSLLLSLALVAGCSKLATRSDPLPEDARAPELELTSHVGEPVSLASQLDAADRVVVVFYRGHW